MVSNEPRHDLFVSWLQNCFKLSQIQDHNPETIALNNSNVILKPVLRLQIETLQNRGIILLGHPWMPSTLKLIQFCLFSSVILKNYLVPNFD